MDLIAPFISFIVSALLAFLTMPWLLNFCKRRGLYDMPNERKVHHNKIPRLGGVLFMPCTMVGLVVSLLFLLWCDGDMPRFTLSAFLISTGIFLIYLTGLLDDILGLPARIKFVIQLIASLFLPLCNLYINNLYGFMGIYEIPMWIGYPLTAFLCLLIVNSVNLIDGIDGLASGLSIVALTAFTIIFFQLGVSHYAIFTMGLLGGLSVFFYYNMFGKVENCTKTFMGDTGSLILGYSLSYLFFKLAMENNAVLPHMSDGLMVGATLLIVPTFDLIRVAMRRLMKGCSIFHADKTHMHHRFLAAGFTMHQTLVIILAIQIGFCLLNAGLYSLKIGSTYILPIDIVLFILIQLYLDRRIKKVNDHASVD